MTRESVYVGNALRFPSSGRRAADAPAHRDMHTGRLSLEWPEYEFLATKHIEPQPVDVVEGVVEQRHEVGRVRKRIRLVLDQRLELGI